MSANKEITKFNVNSSWVVSQYTNQYNPVHWHNGHISGAGFLKVPSTFGETFQKDKRKFKWTIIFDTWTKSFHE